MTTDGERRSPRAEGLAHWAAATSSFAPLVTPNPRRFLRRLGHGLLVLILLLGAAGGLDPAVSAPVLPDQTSSAAAPVANQRLAMVTSPRPPAIEKPAAPMTKAALISLAEATARRHGVDQQLVHAVILAESAYDPKALSHKGAMGLMQLIPATARRYGVSDPWDPAQNLDGGVRYLRDLLRRFKRSELALAAYNAGEAAVQRYGNSVPPYQETETYVARTAAYLERLEAGAAVSKLIRSGVATSARLFGWGLIFGFFPQRAEALSLVRTQRGRLQGKLKRARPAVVRRKLANGTRYGALLVGLSEGEAGPACKHLWTYGAYCIALTPSELKDPQAIWHR